MKKFTLFMTMFIAFAMTAFAQVDYTPTNVTATNKTRNDRNLISVKVGTETYTLSTTEQTYCYVDKYEDVVFTVEAGQEVALDITTNGSWTHGSVYVDFDNNGFTAGVTENWKPTGDLVAYAFYNNGSSSDESGWNSVGTVVSGDNRNRPAIPSYIIPAETPAGEYRIRFKLDWCNIDPNGDADGKFGDFMENGGQIVDAKLVVNATVAPEPELPALEITGYTPTEAVEKLETITITFNDEIEGTFDMMAMSQIHLGSRSNGCSFAVEGNILTITPFNAITTPGEYGLVIPEGLITRKANGEKISLNKEIVFEVKAPLAALEITGYTPTEAVEKLETITITFNDEIEGTFDMMAMSQIHLGSRSNGCSFAVEGNVLTITPFNAITTPGEYGLVIPEGLITRKVNGEKISLNKEIVFTVKAADPIEETESRVLELTFNKISATEANVVVVESNVEASEITATITSNYNWKELTANSEAFPNASIVCPDKNTKDMTAGNEGTITLTLNNVPEGYSFKNVTFTSVALNGGGAFQGDDVNAQLVDFTLTKGETTLGVAEEVKIKVNSSPLEYNNTKNQSVTVPFEVEETYTAENGTLELKLTLSAASNNGCFYGLIKVAIDTEVAAAEPELPALEITGYTPTEAVESLETITITFNDEIEGTFDMMAMSQIYLGSRSNGCSFAVEGNVLTITPFNAITTPGEYGLVIPEGLITRKANGEKISLNKEITFTVKEAIAALEITGYTPTEAVEKLETITITFNDEIEGTFDMMAMSQIYLGSRSNGCSFAVEGNVLTITPFNAITTPGEYALVIPEGLITRKVNGEKISLNKEIVFTVKEATVEPEVTYYRIKTTTVTGDAIYLNIGNTDEHQTGPKGGVNIVAYAEDDNQLFTIEEAAEGWSYLKSKSGYYIKGWAWNVDGSASQKSELEFEDAGEGTFYIKGEKGYFKVEWVDDNYYPFCDAPISAAAKWTLEQVGTVEPEPEPEVDEATVALIATAKELIALEGIGYPAAAPRAELQAAIDAAEAAATTEAGTALQAAINAYYAATDVVLPENGKVYTFKAVYGNNKFYIYNNNGTLAVAACGDEELPESAKFICEYDSEDDFMFQFKTADGAYYLAYPTIGGKGWLDGESATGLEAESAQVTKFNISKILAGGEVKAQNNELLGLVTLNGWRGYDNGKNTDSYGPIVVKHSALAFDGASAPYYNENFTSAFCIEESEVVVTPLSVVAVTPNEAVETLQEITIEFDAEIAVDPVNINACTIDYLGWNVIIGTTATVEGNVLKLVAYSPIKDKGTHYLTIPAGVVTRASDGVAYEGGKFEFEVKEKAVEPLTVVKVTPEAEVRTLDVITIEFSHNVFVNAMGTAVATIANADNSVKVTFSPMDIKCEGNVVTFDLGENAITVAGEYTLDIPSGIIARNDGVKYSGTHTFTVVAPKTFAVDAYLFPTPQGDVTEIKAIRVDANQGASLSDLPTGWTFTNEEGKEFEMDIQWLNDFVDLFISFNPAITEAGTYTLTIPAGSLKTDDGKECEAATFQFTVVAPAVPLTIVSQTPAADEEVEKLETITVTFSENIEVTGIEATDLFPIYSENSTWPAAMANWSVYGNVLTLNLGSAITEAGTYKLILPAEFFAGIEGGAKMESDAVIYFTVNDTTGIEGVDAEGEQTIYDLTGRKIETITKGGIYIVNGKKVLVK